MPSSSSILFSVEEKIESGEVWADGKKMHQLSDSELLPFRQYAEWITEQLNESLSRETQVKLVIAEVRTAHSGSEGTRFGDWHHDGLYVAITTSLYGDGTQYLVTNPKIDTAEFFSQGKEHTEGKPYLTAPLGHSLIFSARERWKKRRDVPSTIHRSPPEDSDRMLLILRFEEESD